MNAPLPESIRLALDRVTLDDKYTLERGHAFMSGVHALVRLPMLQRQRDALAGLNTAGFISGYRGSPLGTYDQALWSAKKHLAAQNIVFQPGVNEELGATAVWGTQQLDLFASSKKFDGVFGIWYGKGPGADRCSDVFKHANMAGTAKYGGVIAIAGDDHIAKSSTAAHQSDHIFKACGLPVFFPSSVQDILDMGLHAFAMSRFAGVWAGMKTIQEIVESASSVSVDPDRVNIVWPEDFSMPPGGLHIRWPDAPLAQEARLMDYKWYAALAYVRANRLNHNVIAGPHDRFGIIASGKAYNDTRQALHNLGLDDESCRRLGIRLHKVNVVWPLEASITRDFALGLEEILVVEEKRQVIEYQIKEELYNWRPDVRPHVLGKFDEPEGDLTGGEWSRPNPSENWLLRAQADLNPAIIAKAIAKRINQLGVDEDTRQRMADRVAIIEAKERSLEVLNTQGHTTGERVPWFCSGCPHNTSTQVPEGSRASGGIGCHYMVLWMDRQTSTFTQMGGEGVTWVGQAPFTTDQHIFTNLGDGTYYHSGLLAIRQSITAKVNITYKILYNDAVAMTGGQAVEGGLSVPAITRELQAEGVRHIVIVTDDPEKYDNADMQDPTVGLAPGVTVHHRDLLDLIQKELRKIKGCTVLIYDQICATEKRRRRKRGSLPDPAKHVMINEQVCEGCGDCSTASHCLSVEPLETEFGRKRKINQHSCNKDFSCVKGFCPSFVTIEGGEVKKVSKGHTGPSLEDLPMLPEPVLPDTTGPWGIVVAGVGGTGVITIGQLLGMAAHLEGKGVMTQDAAGLAQKGGATWSHIQIANDHRAIRTTKVATAEADLILGCDPIVTAHPATLATLLQGRSHVVLNTHTAPTAAFVQDADWQFPAEACHQALLAAVGDHALYELNAESLAVGLLGDSIFTNPLLLGAAWQWGLIPLGRDALWRAIELNGVQIERNHAAFEWGRHAAHDLKKIETLIKPAIQVIHFKKSESLDEIIQRRVEFLTHYQSSRYAKRYATFVNKVRSAETSLNLESGRLALTETVARYLFKLMAYKDEYEVARLHSSPEFVAKIADQFEGNYKIIHHFAPPLFAKKDSEGRPLKRAYGPWIRKALPWLARGKILRGTPLDIFGFTRERRSERALIKSYRASLDELLPGLSAERLPMAIQIARLPEEIRGYGHVKEKHLQSARERWHGWMAEWRSQGGC